MQPMCIPCWHADNPESAPYKREHPDLETCAWCGRYTTSGIYVRVDPATVSYPKSEQEEP
jgi:hypothetical protein